MGNTVGSISVKKLLSEKQAAYILGLWCADGYQRTSSIGLSNTDENLIERFGKFLLKAFSRDRLRLRVYHPVNLKAEKINLSRKIISLIEIVKIVYYPSEKAKKIAYHLYLNSRPLLREFKLARKRIPKIKRKVISSYLAGRFDGDGSLNKKMDRDFRILYSNLKEAEIDKTLFGRIGIKKTKIYHYKSAHTFCLYVSRYETAKAIKLFLPYSVYLQQKLALIPRRDLVFR